MAQLLNQGILLFRSCEYLHTNVEWTLKCEIKRKHWHRRLNMRHCLSNVYLIHITLYISWCWSSLSIFLHSGRALQFCNTCMWKMQSFWQNKKWFVFIFIFLYRDYCTTFTNSQNYTFYISCKYSVQKYFLYNDQRFWSKHMEFISIFLTIWAYFSCLLKRRVCQLHVLLIRKRQFCVIKWENISSKFKYLMSHWNISSHAEKLMNSYLWNKELKFGQSRVFWCLQCYATMNFFNQLQKSSRWWN